MRGMRVRWDRGVGKVSGDVTGWRRGRVRDTCFPNATLRHNLIQTKSGVTQQISAFSAAKESKPFELTQALEVKIKWRVLLSLFESRSNCGESRDEMGLFLWFRYV